MSMSDTQGKRYPRRIPGFSNDGCYWLILQPGKVKFFTSSDGREPSEHFSIYTEEQLDEMLEKKELTETLDHLPSLPEKETAKQCPMDCCLAPDRLQLLEDFYTEVKRIQNEVSGTANVGLALSRAIEKVRVGG